jgi:4-amino-4-deoxy-L-arabinose transferase-like glycosyltransferase
MQRTIRFAYAMNQQAWKETYRSAHPGVTVMWAGYAGIGPDRMRDFFPGRNDEALPRLPGYLEAFAGARQGVAVTNAALVALSAVLLCRLLGAGPGLFGALFVALDPYLVGTGQVLHVDALLPPFMVVAVLAALVYWHQGGTTRYWLISAVATALALLTKAPAVAAVAFIGIMGLVSRRASLPRRFGMLVLWGVIIATLYIALWPSALVNPVLTISDVARYAMAKTGAAHEARNFLFGQPLDVDPGPIYYPVTTAYRLGLLTCLGLLALVLRWRSLAFRRQLTWILAFGLFFMAIMTLGAKKLDRYMLPTLICLNILAGVGLWSLVSTVRNVRFKLLAVALLVGFQAAVLAQSYPYPVASFNPLLGGLPGAEQQVFVGWGEGLEQAANYLDSLPDAQRLGAGTLYDEVFRAYFRGSTWPTGSTLRPDQEINYEYFVLYVNMVQRDLIPPALRTTVESEPPIFVGKVHGEDVVWIYRVPSDVYVPPRKQRAGQAPPEPVAASAGHADASGESATLDALH